MAAAAALVKKGPTAIAPEHLEGLRADSRFVLFDGDHQYVCTETRNPHWLAKLGVGQPWAALEAERLPQLRKLYDEADDAPQEPQEQKQDAAPAPAKASGGWFGWGSAAAASPPASPATKAQLQRELIEKQAQLRQQPLERVFDEPEQEIFSIRGANYLEDNVKIKTPPFAMRLIGVDCFVCSDEEVDANAFIGNRPDLLVQRARAARRAQEAGLSEQERAELLQRVSPSGAAAAVDDKDLFGHPTTHPFIFIMHFLLPGAHCIIYFSNGTTSPYTGTDKPFDTVFRRFLNGSDEERRQRLKIIPHVFEGNYLVQKTASNKPAILGTKMTQHHRHSPAAEDNWFEVSLDVRSSKIARGILSVVRGYTTRVVMDLGFVVEGQSPTELPERVLGSIRCHRFDFAHMPPLPTDCQGEAIPEECKMEAPRE